MADELFTTEEISDMMLASSISTLAAFIEAEAHKVDVQSPPDPVDMAKVAFGAVSLLDSDRTEELYDGAMKYLVDLRRDAP